jgi:hypothetical protein
MIDYRDLLMKYIAHVGHCESVDYIDDRKFQSCSPGLFTPEEAAELGNLSTESRKYD